MIGIRSGQNFIDLHADYLITHFIFEVQNYFIEMNNQLLLKLNIVKN